jgi:uncharacterized protein YecE (DUF72 family)
LILDEERGIFREYLIGTGGWAYFQVPGLTPLKAYSRVFDFVEVNSTFYHMPPLGLVEKWRKHVPSDFQFSVRTHRSMTHKHELKPAEDVFEGFERMKRICSALGANVLHLLLPASFILKDESIWNMRDLLASLNLEKLRLAMEIRGNVSSPMPSSLAQVMSEHNVIHCVDLSKGEMPAYESDTLYTRLFGKGDGNVYQPTDKELKEIDRKVMGSEAEKIVMSFHFVRMYKDAARLKTYKQTGKFPMITKSKGLASLKDVVAEDAKFPSTKQELISSQGWKLFDFDEKKRIHAGNLLRRLPEGMYRDVNEVAASLVPFAE